MSIHPSAVIDPSSRIGDNVTIGPFVVIGPQCVIGDNCRIISNAVVEYTELGVGCIIYPQASLGLPPQHLGYKDEKTKLVVGKNCTFREGVTVHRGTAQDKSVTRIGNNGYFMALSHIAHDCVVGNDVIMANGAQLAGHVEVGDRVFVSALSGIHQRVRIGSFAMISGGAMVPVDVTPFATIQGDRAILRGLNLVGMKRGGLDRDTIRLIKEAYRVVFYSGFILAEALKEKALHVDNPQVKILRDFLTAPGRGFIRPLSSSTKGSEEEVLV